MTERAGTAPAIKELIDSVNVERIRADVEELCGSPRHGEKDPEAHSAAADYIAGQLETAGCEVERLEFTVPSVPETRAGLNVIGTLPAEVMDSAMLIGAHYDTVVGSPGADDDASGVAAMLECARVLGQLQLRRPIIFAAFDAEERQPEVGLHGATAYVDSLTASGSQGSLAVTYILEMVGYSAPAGGQKIPPGLQLAFPRAFDLLREAKYAGNSVVAISNHFSHWAGRAFEMASNSIENGVPVLPMEIPRWLGVPLNLRRSDHAPFWEAGIPAVMVGDTANFRNPNYHRATDTPDTLDYTLIHKVTRSMVRLALQHGMTAAHRVQTAGEERR